MNNEPGSENAKELGHNPPASPLPETNRLKFILIVSGVLVAMALVAWLVIESYYIVETDDAYVNSHVTFVAPQVAGKVEKVLVQDNNRVRKGDILVELDKRPYQVQMDIAKAALDSAKADLLAATAQAKSDEVNALSLYYKLNSAIENVNSQVAQLHQNIAALNQAEASLTLAKSDFSRAQQLFKGNVTSHESFDSSKEKLRVAESQFNQAYQSVNALRAGLGLPSVPADSAELEQVPANLDQTFSGVQQAQALVMSAAEQLGVTFPSVYMTPKQLLAFFQSKAPNANAFFAEVLPNAPSVKQAQAKLEQAQGNFEQAVLNLHYCDVTAAIDGVITRRNLNPGNYVQSGQELMAIRSLSDIWVDANFKETQLSSLRIGQPVDLETDMYGGRHVFQGRISGFTMGTGSTLALLPPQNATGNFVKVVQRLPVRIDVLDYNPDQIPLFVGLSVTPKVHIRSKPTGTNAGQFLQDTLRLPAEPKPESPAK